MKTRLMAFLVSTLATWAGVAQAQEKAPEARPSFQGGTRLVVVPVVVRDRDGRTVTDLRQESFEVLDRGKAQRIVSFSRERAGEAASAAAPERFTAYFFDDVSMRDISSVTSVREGALKSMTSLQPGDRVALFSSSCRLAVDFTDDVSKLRAGIASLQAAAIPVCRVARTVPLQVIVLEAVVNRMAHLPGARRIVVVSGGFPVSRDEQKRREQLIGVAAQAKVVIDAMHVAQPLVYGQGYSESAGMQSAGPVDFENLNIIADGTGGTVVEAGNAAEAGLRRLATPDCVYMLGFVPEGIADGSYHKLKVNVKDPRKLNLRARAGYYATEPGQVAETVSATAVALPAAPGGAKEVADEASAAPPAGKERPAASAQPAAPAGERTATSQPITFRARASVVLVPVVVHDRDGRAVGHLRKSDFQLWDRGERQEITSFSEERLERAEAAKGAPEGKPGEAAAGKAAPAIVPDRFTAYLFDDVHMRIGDMAQVKNAVSRSIQESLGPSERAAIFTTSRRHFVDFTSDREKLHEAMLKIMPEAPYRSVFDRSGDVGYFFGYQVSRGNTVALRAAAQMLRGIPSSQTVSEMRASAAAERAVRAGERETELSLDALRDISRRMASLAGRRTIVLLSHGFFVADEQQDELAHTIDWALRSGVVIHTLNSSGLLTGMEEFSWYEDDTAGDGPFITGARLEGATTLRTIADGTGGTAIESSNDYIGGVRRLATAPEYRYLLGFAPRGLAADGSFHKLTVKVASGDAKQYTVQTRRGYYAPAKAEGLSEAAIKEIENAVFARDIVRDLPVEMRTEVMRAEGSGGDLAVTTEVDLKLLHYRKQDGRNSEDLTAVVAVFDRDGNFVAGKEQILRLRLLDETLGNLEQRPPEKLGANFGLGPGTYLVRLVVRSADEQTMATETKMVEVQ